MCQSPIDTVIERTYNVITMKVAIITIGNSKGIRIPKPLLEESGLGNIVELRAKKGEIKLLPPADLKDKALNEEYVLSLNSLSDWNDPAEDRAWVHLQ